MFCIKYLLFSFLFIGSAGTLARPYQFGSAGIEMDFPENWSVDYRDDEPDVIYASSPDEAIILMVNVLPFENPDTLFNELKENILQDYASFRLIKKEARRINGMQALTGRAKLDFDTEQSDILTFAIIRTSTNKALIITTVNDEQTNTLMSAVINRIINSIKPI